MPSKFKKKNWKKKLKLKIITFVLPSEPPPPQGNCFFKFSIESWDLSKTLEKDTGYNKTASQKHFGSQNKVNLLKKMEEKN